MKSNNIISPSFFCVLIYYKIFKSWCDHQDYGAIYLHLSASQNFCVTSKINQAGSLLNSLTSSTKLMVCVLLFSLRVFPTMKLHYISCISNGPNLCLNSFFFHWLRKAQRAGQKRTDFFIFIILTNNGSYTVTQFSELEQHIPKDSGTPHGGLGGASPCLSKR